MAGVWTNLFELGLLLVFLVLACWWVFGNHGVRRVSQRPDYGLLSPVARTDSTAAAESVRLRLELAGVRATIAPAGLGFTASGHPWPADAQVVLVFGQDLATAERVLRPAPSR